MSAFDELAGVVEGGGGSKQRIGDGAEAGGIEVCGVAGGQRLRAVRDGACECGGDSDAGGAAAGQCDVSVFERVSWGGHGDFAQCVPGGVDASGATGEQSAGGGALAGVSGVPAEGRNRPVEERNRPVSRNHFAGRAANDARFEAAGLMGCRVRVVLAGGQRLEYLALASSTCGAAMAAYGRFGVCGVSVRAVGRVR